MFKVDFVQMKSILATLVKPVSDQAAVFDALNYNPYDDDENDQFGGTYHSVVMPNYSYKSSYEDMATYPVDYGICDEDREVEIKAGSPLTSLEKQLIDDKIFEDDDTYMVINKFSDGKDEVFGLKVHQVQGQLGIQVIDFLGFFSSEEDAEAAITESDYKIYEPF